MLHTIGNIKLGGVNNGLFKNANQELKTASNSDFKSL